MIGTWSRVASDEEQIQKLTTALQGAEWLIRQCQSVLELHLQNRITTDETVTALLRLLDGPEQRRIHETAREALDPQS